ncbi:MAG TPA: response regulator [Mucilaginibacter sp.]|jgi:two-component system phosphate regulon response regulator PhoB|nr:response regulator [Mucilaginibacter sp.]
MMPKKVLIIEDDKSILQVLENVLGFNNFEVIGINRTDDILETITKYNPDLVLTDYLLPGMNGGKICQLIKSNAATYHLPVILISAYHELAISLGSFGFDAFIPKPFDINNLVKTINKLLNSK